MITDLEQLLNQERELQFSQFDNDDAWLLGCLLKANAEAVDAHVAIDITRNGHCLFSFAMPQTSIDNQKWIERKRNVVDRYQHSSWYMAQYYKAKGKTIEQASLVDAKQFAPFGGSFPLIVKGVGVIGSVTVSGLPQYEDHKLVVDTITQFLAQQ
ncbi:heme-degrading domain-containing protein [Vibrio sp. SCSIO 43136]|uniref:heme-degrading domain-containing protein n=1 Tax=Vibrio sp. SCSIO 43136 TaxID=2819101 RepID=UPI0020754AB0|nr:heme-degrading domain-containing protein [Vibrio sp. SCSIO 43136]USD67220.1 heme-degrading domain-containing protein [Vibrio sp. SCSIO 43136]